MRAFPDSSKVAFNNLGQQLSVSDRFGNALSYSYDSLGRLARIYDPIRKDNTGSGLTYTSIGYGSGFGLAAIREPGPDGTPGNGRQTTITISSDSTLASIGDPDGVSTRFAYDSKKRLVSVIDRRGDTTSYAYRTDSSWKLSSQSSPSVPTDIGGGNTSLQRPTVTMTPWQVISVPTATTASSPATPVLTDSIMAVVVDPNGRANRFTVDHWGQPMRIVLPFGLTSKISRSGIFPVVDSTPTGTADSAIYNSSGLLILSTIPGLGTTLLRMARMPYRSAFLVRGSRPRPSSTVSTAPTALQ